MLKVVKFGGSSVCEASQFKRVKEIVEADEARKIVVISAAGKRSSDDHKITDLLYLCHAHISHGFPCENVMDIIRKRFIEIRDDLGLACDIEGEFDKLASQLKRDISLDELVSRGEYFTAMMMAEFLGYTFVDAANLVFFRYDGSIDEPKTYTAIRYAYEEYGKIVIPGFYGIMPTGKVKVMTRGGSDISGSIAAAAVDADVYENWTDVSGILMADPKIVENPASIAKLTYAEVRELSYMGASVLHEDSILPVKEKSIPLNILNTNEPQNPGTLIVSKIDDEERQDRFLTGVAGRKDFSIITIHKYKLKSSDTLRKALEVMDKYHLTVELIDTDVDTFAFIVSTKSIGEARFDIIADLRKACEPKGVDIVDNLALVAAVGRKMTFKPGISGELFKALGENGINIRTIAQGADELSITIGVDNDKFEETVKILYDKFAG